MFDHVGIYVRDFDETKRFYLTVLEPLGFELTADGPKYLEFGALSFGRGQPPTPPLHFAFLARTRKAVDDFHTAGVAAGYRSNGAPGIREYADDYYAAYLFDPDGHNVEAVHRDPEERRSWTWLRWEP